MRRIVLHRRAVKYLRCMPRDRQTQIVQALEENAAVQNPSEFPTSRRCQESSPDGTDSAPEFTAPSCNPFRKMLAIPFTSITSDLAATIIENPRPRSSPISKLHVPINPHERISRRRGKVLDVNPMTLKPVAILLKCGT